MCDPNKCHPRKNVNTDGLLDMLRATVRWNFVKMQMKTVYEHKPTTNTVKNVCHCSNVLRKCVLMEYTITYIPGTRFPHLDVGIISTRRSMWNVQLSPSKAVFLQMNYSRMSRRNLSTLSLVVVQLSASHPTRSHKRIRLTPSSPPLVMIIINNIIGFTLRKITLNLYSHVVGITYYDF